MTRYSFVLKVPLNTNQSTKQLSNHSLFYYLNNSHKHKITIDPAVFVAISVCKFQCKINFEPEKLIF